MKANDHIFNNFEIILMWVVLFSQKGLFHSFEENIQGRKFLIKLY